MQSSQISIIARLKTAEKSFPNFLILTDYIVILQKEAYNLLCNSGYWNNFQYSVNPIIKYIHFPIFYYSEYLLGIDKVF